MRLGNPAVTTARKPMSLPQTGQSLPLAIQPDAITAGCGPPRGSRLPPSPRLRRTAVALAEAGPSEALRFRLPDPELLPEEHQLANVIRGVIGDEHDLAQVGLPGSVRNRHTQIDSFVGSKTLEGATIARAVESPDQPALPVTDLASAMPRGLPSRNLVAARLVLGLEDALREFSASGYGGFADDWAALDALRDARVRVQQAGERVEGTARGTDRDGALLVESAGRVLRVFSGDVSVRSAAS